MLSQDTSKTEKIPNNPREAKFTASRIVPTDTNSDFERLRVRLGIEVISDDLYIVV